MCSGRPLETISVVNSRRKSCGVNLNRLTRVGQAGIGGEFVQQPTDHGVRNDFLTVADLAGEQVGERFTVQPLVWVVPNRQRDVSTAGLGSALNREEHRDQLRTHGDQPFGVGLAGDDVQQRHQRAGGLGGVVAKRQLGQFQHLLDSHAGMAQCLDDRPGPEPVCFGLGDIHQPVLQTRRGSRGIRRYQFGA
jgi:hypothetical protein